MSSELDEWEAAAKAGAAARRKKMVPIVAGVGAFLIVFGGVFLGLGAMWGNHAEEQEAEKAARLERGETVVEFHRRGSTKETRAAGDGLLLVIVAAGAGAVAGAVAFFALGGKLSAEYQRGIQSMGR